MVRIMVVALALVWAVQAHARSDLKDIKGIFAINVVDGVTDGCLARPNELKKPWELEFLRSRLKIEEKPQHPLLEIEVVGLELKTTGAGKGTGNCVAHIAVRVWACAFFRYSWQTDTDYSCNILVWKTGAVLYYSTRQEMQAQLEQMSAKFARDFALDYEKGQVIK